MSRVIAVIEECEIVLQNDGRVTFTAKAAIDGDGTGPSHGDPDYQSHTTYKPDLNADVDRYIVVPPAIIRSVVPVVIGCQVEIHNRLTDLRTTAVVGDVGPKHKLGEISIATAKALGIPSSPTTGGEEEHVIDYVIFPGIPATVDGKTYHLQPS